jgi:hypothetical protein
MLGEIDEEDPAQCATSQEGTPVKETSLLQAGETMLTLRGGMGALS